MMSKHKGILDGDTAQVCQLIDSKDPFPFELWKKSCANNWMPTEIPMGKDIEQWNTPGFLTEDEKLLVKRTLGFFAGSESLVGSSVIISEYPYVTDGGIRQYLLRKAFEESLHNVTIAVCCEAFNLNVKEVAEAYKNIPSIKAKDQLLLETTTEMSELPIREVRETIEGKQKFVRNIFMFYIVCEGMWFYPGFAMILALGRQNKMTGLCDQIRYTLRDESNHLEAGVYLINKIKKQYPDVWTKDFQQELINIGLKAVELEINYAKETLPNGILGLNADMFIDYMEFIGNRRFESIGLNYRFPSDKNPFPWLGAQADVQPMGAFFERRERSYQQQGALEDDL